MGFFYSFMKTTVLVLIMFSVISTPFTQNKGAIKFTFIDSKTRETLSDSVYLEILSPEDTIKISIKPDIDGNYIYKSIDPTKAIIKVLMKGYEEFINKKVRIYADQICYVAIVLTPMGKANSKNKRVKQK